MAAARLTLRAGLALAAAGWLLALLAGGLGRLIPSGELAAIPLGLGMSLDIYLLDLERGLFANLTRTTAWEGYPALSPDGRRVVFSSFRDGSGELYVQTIGEQTAQRITHSIAFDGEAAWSPDGQQIVFVMSDSGLQNLFVSDLAGLPRVLYRTAGLEASPAWSPDGCYIAFIAARGGDPADIYLMNADGSGMRPVTRQPGYDLFPAWSPDGRHLAFASDRGGRLDLYALATACLETPAGCTLENPRQLTRGGAPIEKLWWSRDGKRLLYLERTVGLPEIYAVDFGCDLEAGGCFPRPITQLRQSLRLARARQ